MGEVLVRRRRRVSLWAGLALIALCLVMLPALYFAPLSRVQSELVRLRAAGVLRDRRDLIPVLRPGEQNAADLYAQAFLASTIGQAETSLAYTLDAAGNGPIVSPVRFWTPQQRTAIQGILAADAREFALLARAAQVRTCFYAPGTSRLREMRDKVRWLGMRARLQAANGDVDGALSSLRLALRMGEHMQGDPQVISQLFGDVMYLFAWRDMQEVFAAGDPSPAACRALYDQLGAVPLDETWVRGLQGELARDVDTLDQLRRGAITPRALLNNGNPPASLRDLVATSYPTVGRPLLDRDEVRYLRMMEQVIGAAGKPWPEAKQLLERLPTVGGPLGDTLDGHWPRFQEQHEGAAAHLGAMRIALALKVFRGERGRYPRDLTELQRSGWKLPRDPFTLGPYRYRPYGRGFLLYSLGPDMQDQGGQPATPGASNAYDIPFRCAR